METGKTAVWLGGGSPARCLHQAPVGIPAKLGADQGPWRSTGFSLSSCHGIWVIHMRKGRTSEMM